MTSLANHIERIAAEPKQYRVLTANAEDNLLLNYLLPAREQKVITAMARDNPRAAIDLCYHQEATGDSYPLSSNSAASLLQGNLERAYHYCIIAFSLEYRIHAESEQVALSPHRLGQTASEPPLPVQRRNRALPASRQLFVHAYLRHLQNDTVKKLVPYAASNHDLAGLFFLDNALQHIDGELAEDTIDHLVSHADSLPIGYVIQTVLQPYEDATRVMKTKTPLDPIPILRRPASSTIYRKIGRAAVKVGKAIGSGAAYAVTELLPKTVAATMNAGGKTWEQTVEACDWVNGLSDDQQIGGVLAIGTIGAFAMFGGYEVVEYFKPDAASMASIGTIIPDDPTRRQDNKSSISYAVKPGDSLRKIAREQCKNRASWQDLQRINGLQTYVIHPNQQLRLPKACRKP